MWGRGPTSFFCMWIPSSPNTIFFLKTLLSPGRFWKEHFLGLYLQVFGFSRSRLEPGLAGQESFMKLHSDWIGRKGTVETGLCICKLAFTEMQSKWSAGRETPISSFRVWRCMHLPYWFISCRLPSQSPPPCSPSRGAAGSLQQPGVEGLWESALTPEAFPSQVDGAATEGPL